MRITHLRIHNVRRHADLALDFAPGLNVVCGPNEAGKSTLQKAIEMGLFRSATSTAQELTDLRSWTAGPEDDPEIEIDFDEEGTAGHLVKNFARSAGSVSLRLGDQTMTDPRQVDQSIAEITGLPSEKFYRSTAGIRHSEIATLDSEDGGLRDELQKSMSGADRGTAQAKKRLQEAIRFYKLEGPKNVGPLRSTRDEIARLHAELTRGETELGRLERDRSVLATANASRLVLDERLAAEEGRLAHAEHAMELLTQERDAQERYDRYRRATDLRAEIDRLDTSHPSKVPLEKLKDGVDRLRQMEYDISEVRAELSSEPDPSTHQAAPVPSRWTLWAIVGALVLVGAIGLGTFGLVSGSIFLLVIAVPFAIGGVLCLVRGRQMRALAADVRRGNELLEAEVQRHAKGRSERRDRVRAAERERDAELTALHVGDMASAEKLLEAETEHVGAIKRLQAEEHGVMGDLQTDGDLAELRDAAAAEAAQARHALAGMGEQGRDPAADRIRLRATVDATRRQRDAALGEEGQARGRVDANDVDAEAVAGVAERLAAAEERQQLLDRRLRIYQLTLDAIETAEQQTMQKAARFLEQHMGKDISTLTDGRYRRIQVDEQTLAFKVFSAERGDWIPATSLSRGTLDQLYLSARLGLVRQLTGDRQPPLILDDPFVTFDDARATRAVELLKRLTADFQVIYLTCSNRYDQLADRLIELPEPTAKDTGDGSSATDGSAPAPSPAAVIVSNPAAAAVAAAATVPEGPSLWDKAEPGH